MEDEQNNGYTEVFTWGSDRCGQMGLSSSKADRAYIVPRFCSFNVIIQQMACGYDHSAFIASNGCIYTMGSNVDGKLGISLQQISTSSAPCLVDSLSRHRAIRVSCGRVHTAAVMESGDLYTWGNGSEGQLGLGTLGHTTVPQRVRFQRRDGLCHQISVLDVDCGERHTTVLSIKGEIYSMGSNELGQLGTGCIESEQSPTYVDFHTRIRKISAGASHTLVLTENGRIYAAGNNKQGQLGVGSRKSSLAFVRVTAPESLKFKKVAAGSYSAAFCAKGELYLWGTCTFGEFLTPRQIGQFKHPLKRLSIGSDFGSAIDSKGNIYSWGDNSYGQLGTGDYEPRTGPEAISLLQGKRVTAVSCGGCYTIALGNTINNSSHYQTNCSAWRSTAEQGFQRSADDRSRRSVKADSSAPRSLNTSDAHFLRNGDFNHLRERPGITDKSYIDEQNRSYDNRSVDRSYDSRGVDQSYESGRKRAGRSSTGKTPARSRRTDNTSTSFVSTKGISRSPDRERRRSSSKKTTFPDTSEKKDRSKHRSGSAAFGRPERSRNGYSDKKEKTPLTVKSPDKHRSRGPYKPPQLKAYFFNQETAPTMQTASFDDAEDKMDIVRPEQGQHSSGRQRSGYERKAPIDRHQEIPKSVPKNENLKPENKEQYQHSSDHQNISAISQPTDPRTQAYENEIENNRREIHQLKITIEELKCQVVGVGGNRERQHILYSSLTNGSPDRRRQNMQVLQEELQHCIREKAKTEHLLHCEKEHSAKLSRDLEECVRTIKELEQSHNSLTNADLQKRSMSDELQKERDLCHRKIDDLAAQLDIQQSEYNSKVSNKEKLLDEAHHRQHELESKLHETVNCINALERRRDEDLRLISESKHECEEVKRDHSRLRAQNEELERVVAGFSNRYEQQNRNYNDMVTDKEGNIARTEQSYDRLRQDKQRLSVENEELQQAVDQKSAQVMDLRHTVAGLEAALSQKSRELQQAKRHLSDPSKAANSTVLDRPTQTQSFPEVSSYVSDDQSQSHSQYEAYPSRDPGMVQQDSNSRHSGASLSPHKFSSYQRVGPSPQRVPRTSSPKTSHRRSPGEPSMYQSQDHLQLSASGSGTYIGSKREPQGEKLRSISKSSAIKHITKTANKLVEILGDGFEGTEVDSRVRQPLQTKDENEGGAALTAKFQEEQDNLAQLSSAKSHAVTRTLQAVEIPWKSTSGGTSRSDLLGRPKHSFQSVNANKENPAPSDQSATGVNNLGHLKSRLQDLQKNKNALEQRMQEFEKKLKDGKRK